MTPEARARLIELPDALRAWARESVTARLHLSAHVNAGLPLGHALAALAAALGEHGADEVRRRLTEGKRTEKFRPFCSAELGGGLRCRALTTTLVHLARGGAVERCDDCARAHEREHTGRALRRLAGR
ncbi:MAG: hypothetical protein JWM10_5354 [Myxococcaceae bacterium]|nr:hypothetical protein [Myxococcaceae bacterium]